MELWSFVQNTCGAWLWRCVGGLCPREGLGRFPTLNAAMDDAELHGLIPGESRLGPVIRHTRRPLLTSGGALRAISDVRGGPLATLDVAPDSYTWTSSVRRLRRRVLH